LNAPAPPPAPCAAGTRNRRALSGAADEGPGLHRNLPPTRLLPVLRGLLWPLAAPVAGRLLPEPDRMPWLLRPTCLLQAADVCISQHQQQVAPSSCANLRVVVAVRVRAAQQMATSQQMTYPHLSAPARVCPRLSAPASLGRNPRKSAPIRRGIREPRFPRRRPESRSPGRVMRGLPRRPTLNRSNAGEGADRGSPRITQRRSARTRAKARTPPSGKRCCTASAATTGAALAPARS
jgi:hypothetical protein